MNIKRKYRNLRMIGRKFRYEVRYRMQKTNLTQILQNKEKILFVTNDNFGGTRQFEDNYVKNHEHVIILRRHSYGERPDLIYELKNNDTNETYWGHLKEIEPLWNYNFSKIVVNTMVHCSEIKLFLKHILEYKKQHGSCQITYMVHDFNSICVRCNLFVNNHFCRLACEKEQCSLCLGNSNIRINEWRSMWSEFLSQCDKIHCFSTSSKLLMLEAYPNLKSNRIEVIPHDISFIKFTPIEGIERLPFHLGIVGNCSADFKGRAVVEQILKKYGDAIPITLIGSSYKDFWIRKKLVKYTGPYRHDDLQKIIQEQQVSHVLFPSLCPETFSYLISELIAMELPIICFDYGAQAEKTRIYDKGVVCEDLTELWRILDDMVKRNFCE